jgi:hypothetical protein
MSYFFPFGVAQISPSANFASLATTASVFYGKTADYAISASSVITQGPSGSAGSTPNCSAYEGTGPTGPSGSAGPTGPQGISLTTCPSGSILCSSLTPPSGYYIVCMQIPPGCTARTAVCPSTLP